MSASGGQLDRRRAAAVPAPESPHRAHGTRAGTPTTVAPGGTSSTTTALAPIVAPSPIRTAPMILAPVPMLTLRSIVAPLIVAGAQADRHERRDRHAGADLDRPVDHDLAVEDVDARLDDYRVADRYLRESHREPVRDARQQRYAARLERRLRAVQRLGQEGVADQGEPEQLGRGVAAGAELVPFAAVGGGDLRVGHQRLAEAGMAGPERAEVVLAHRRAGYASPRLGRRDRASHRHSRRAGRAARRAASAVPVGRAPARRCSYAGRASRLLRRSPR